MITNVEPVWDVGVVFNASIQPCQYFTDNSLFTMVHRLIVSFGSSIYRCVHISCCLTLTDLYNKT